MKNNETWIIGETYRYEHIDPFEYLKPTRDKLEKVVKAYFPRAKISTGLSATPTGGGIYHLIVYVRDVDILTLEQLLDDKIGNIDEKHIEVEKYDQNFNRAMRWMNMQ